MCQFEDVNRKKCAAELAANLSTMSYHLVHLHGLVKGDLAKKKRLLTAPKAMSETRIMLSEREQKGHKGWDG